MLFKEDKGTGYLYCYSPNHHCANGAGKVLEHVYVMSQYIGRLLVSGECVHHIDRDRKNNKIENLLLLTNSEHRKLHALEDNHYKEYTYNCHWCGGIITSSVKARKKNFCSQKCSKLRNRQFNPTTEELTRLVWEKPTTLLAKDFNVSDAAISKRCKLLGIEKPPRGYWAKLKYNKI